ncbi:uncharacterized protein LOC116341607 isoform X2 [Contarinia nasturtii]|uniref:uncharacterized protein LOC116341607 isoform X2 n=1 Tax=Contarinia nasturtii TaxID=265458 RepID=UPI0012D441FE|nr:uncharacterized protein LOC116341607 isoform X2 [Contarinia nasturtii]XP_031624634.1 uncharacterized protein LOC116341607 isoform X2 [Contarinia nasturtii]
MQTLFIGLTLLVSYCNGLIVPQELSSVLSLVYSNIPPVKKGTDSRVGFGFRLGEHADFQVMFEIGPQKFTRPIGKGASTDDDSDTSKRMVDQSDYNKKPVAQTIESGNSYLNKWANEMKSKTIEKKHKPQAASVEHDSLKTLFNAKNQYPIPASPVIPESSLRQLQQLMYAKQSDSIPRAIGTLPSKTMDTHIDLAARENTAKLKQNEKIKASLSDVSLDD